MRVLIGQKSPNQKLIFRNDLSRLTECTESLDDSTMLTTMTTMTVTSSKTMTSSGQNQDVPDHRAVHRTDRPDWVDGTIASSKSDFRADPHPVLSKADSNAEIMDFIQKIQLKQKKFNDLIQQELNLLHWKLKNQS